MKPTSKKSNEEMKDGLGAAVEEAYIIVVNGLNYTHKQLCDMFSRYYVNDHTLCNIRDKKPRKKDTNWRYLRIFMYLIDLEYKHRRRNGFDGASTILDFERKISLLLLGLPTEKDIFEEC